MNTSQGINNFVWNVLEPLEECINGNTNTLYTLDGQ